MIVIYHKDCNDGFASALSCYMALKENATYIPMNYNDTLPEIEDGTKIYIVDFSLPKETLLELSARGCEIVILDHHISAERSLSDLKGTKNFEIIFDMSRSGAGIAYDYFFPNQKRPKLINHVEDYDLATFSNKKTKAFMAKLQTITRTLSKWEDVMILLEDESQYDDFCNEGQALLDYSKAIIAQMLNNVRFSEFHEFQNIPIANLPALISESCQHLAELYEKSPFAMTFFVAKEGFLQFSMRRSALSTTDLSLVAARLGGGGHASASGFRLSVEEAKKLLPGLFS